MFTKITNPKTGRKVNIFGKKGIQIINNYLVQLGGHEGPCALNPNGNGLCKKSRVWDNEKCELSAKKNCKLKVRTKNPVPITPSVVEPVKLEPIKVLDPNIDYILPVNNMTLGDTRLCIQWLLDNISWSKGSHVEYAGGYSGTLWRTSKPSQSMTDEVVWVLRQDVPRLMARYLNSGPRWKVTKIFEEQMGFRRIWTKQEYIINEPMQNSIKVQENIATIID